MQGGATNAFNAASATTVNGTLDLGGFDQTIGSLAGTGTGTNNGTANAVLTTNGDNTDTSFGGLIQDGTKTTGLTKTGTGTLTLANANTYSGPTTVTQGTLQLDNVGGAASSDVTLNTGTLRVNATGTLNNNLIFADNVASTLVAATGQTVSRWSGGFRVGGYQPVWLSGCHH